MFKHIMHIFKDTPKITLELLLNLKNYMQ